jgi:hypothetical protein
MQNNGVKCQASIANAAVVIVLVLVMTPALAPRY